MEKQIVVNKDELRELFVEYTRSSFNTSSNLLGDIKKTLNEHSVSIARIESTAVATKNTLDRIETQTIRTNGRVTKIESDYLTEKDIEDISKMNWYTKGAVAIIVLLIPVVSFLCYEVINLMVKDHVI